MKSKNSSSRKRNTGYFNNLYFQFLWIRLSGKLIKIILKLEMVQDIIFPLKSSNNCFSGIFEPIAVISARSTYSPGVNLL